jgi:imidazolonepropionase-like amidohydrolase
MNRIIAGRPKAPVLALGLLAGSALLLAPSSTAAQVRMTVPPQSEPIALTGATIHTVTQGVIENGTIVFDDGVIIAVGADVAIPAGARVVDASGKHIYPGLVDAHTTLGITEIGAVDVSNDINELGDFNPNVRAEVAVNAESRHIGTSRSAGVLVALSAPGGGLVSGMSSALNLEGWSWEEMSMEGMAALNVNWPNPNPSRRWWGGAGGQQGPSYAEQVTKIRDFFADSRAYRDAVEAGQTVTTDSRYAAMIPVLNRQIPVVVAADGAKQINDAITWALEEEVRLVIRGGRDAVRVADRLVEHAIPVLVTATLDGPERDWEGYDAAYRLPAELHAKGVKFAIAGGSGAAYTNRLPWEAGVAVAYGLPEDVALEAVTIAPAQFMGISDRVGSLEPGKEATLLITTGTPLDMTSDIEQAYIQGRELDMMDIQKFFFEKYMTKVLQYRRLVM